MKYLSCAETAKLVRAELKQNFPTIKFSVRSKTYSMGASITVNWDNGPTTKQVESAVGCYHGSDFDPMQDLAYHVDHYMTKDGQVCLAESHHNLEPKKFDQPPDSEKVSFGADYIFCNRHISPEYQKEVADKICFEFGKEPVAEIKTYSGGGQYCEIPFLELDPTFNGFLDRQVSNWFLSIDLTN